LSKILDISFAMLVDDSEILPAGAALNELH
jgi:hypothetical protein